MSTRKWTCAPALAIAAAIAPAIAVATPVCGQVDPPPVSFIRIVDGDTTIPFHPNLATFSMPSLSEGFVAFRGTTALADYTGIFHNNAMSFTKLADTDTAVPGGSGPFTSFGPPSFDELHGAFRGSGFGQQGVYAGFAGPAPAAVAVNGDSTPGGNGTFNLFTNPSIDHDAASGTSSIVFGASTFPTFNSGIYLFGDVPTTVADWTTSIPGGSEPFITFAEPQIDAGVVAFRGEGLSGHVGIYRYLVQSQDLSVVADVGTPIPGGTGSFTSFGNMFSYDILSTGDGNVAFRGGGSGGQEGVYAVVDGTLELIADLNTPVPGGTGNFVAFFDEPPSISGPNVVFHGVASAQGALYGRIDGLLMRIVGTGDVVDDKTVFGVATGPKAIDGDLIAFNANFDDGTSGVYLAVIGEPANPADIDGDGNVDVADLVTVIVNWGPCPGPPDPCPADVNGDGNVDVLDLIEVLVNWGAVAGPPINDECENATLAGAGPIPFSTIGATTSNIYVPDGTQPGFPVTAGLDCDEGAGYAFENDVWFRYVLPQAEGTVTVTTCGLVDFDTRIAVYRAADVPVCALMEGLGCNDDTASCDLGSVVSIPVIQDEWPGAHPGDELYIRVGSNDAALAGSGSLIVGFDTHTPFEDGDEPDGCLELVFGGFPGSGTWEACAEFYWDEETLGSSTGAGDDTPDCGVADTIDEWFCYTAPATGVNRVRVWSIFDPLPGGSLITLAVYDRNGTMLGCAADIEVANPPYGTPSATTFWGAVVGNRYWIRVGTTPEDADVNGYVSVTVTCADDDGCGWPFTGPCFVVNPGVPGCEDPACCALVCDLDPYCCNIEWDGFCASEANSACEPKPSPACETTSQHSCYSVDPGPACNDGDCCAAVCGIDPYCCDIEWDLACVEVAVAVCEAPECTAPTDAPCDAPHIWGGCSDADCCGIVCDIEPLCCDDEWSNFCVNLAELLCDLP